MNNFITADSIVEQVQSDETGAELCYISNDIFSSAQEITNDLRTTLSQSLDYKLTSHERSDEIVKGSLLAVHKLLTMLWIMSHIDTPHPIASVNEEFAEFREMMKQAQELVDEGDI